MKNHLIELNYNIKYALLKLEKNLEKCLVVINSKNILKGTLTDGDIRRALLRGANIHSKIGKYIKKKPFYLKAKNLSKQGKKKKKIVQDAIKKIKDDNIDVIPLLDKNNKVVEIILNRNFNEYLLVEKKLKNVPVLIMAGGEGKRLKQFTNYFPKPLVPIENTTATEHIINSFKKYGVKNFFISLNYKKNLIKSYFRENKIKNLHILEEPKALGTAGSIRMLKGRVKNDFFVINCDTILSINLDNFYDYHKKNNYSITLVAAAKNFKLSYGSCEIKKNGQLKKILEKPNMNYLVSVGLYLFKPEVIKLVDRNKFLGMDDLIKKVKKNGGKVGVFPISEGNWYDTGQPNI